MTFQELKDLIAADQFRYHGKAGARDFLSLWFHETGFKFTVVMRTCAFLRSQRWSRYGFYHLCLLWHRRLQVKYSTYIDFATRIGPGLYLGHACAIVVNGRTVIGRDCTLSQSVTLGKANDRSRHPGCPIIQDRVYIGPGAVVIGAITLEDDCAVGPNSVVVKPVPSMAVVSGIPAQEISQRGSAGYVSHAVTQKPAEGSVK